MTISIRCSREKTKGQFDRTHQLQPNKIKEGDWVGPYMVVSANDNATYQLPVLDGMKIVVVIAGKRVKAFKKRYEPKPNLPIGEDGSTNKDRESGKDRIFNG